MGDPIENSRGNIVANCGCMSIVDDLTYKRIPIARNPNSVKIYSVRLETSTLDVFCK